MDQFKDLDKREIVEIARNHLDTVISVLISLDHRKKSDVILDEIVRNSIRSSDRLTAYLTLLGPPIKKVEDCKVIPMRKGY